MSSPKFHEGQKSTQDNTPRDITTAIPEYPVTVQRKPYVPTAEEESKFKNPGTARANVASLSSYPDGTQWNDYATRHSHQTVLQQHCAFFDPDNDGVVWPIDTYRGCRDIGFNILISILTVIIVHSFLSYPTCHTVVPDPFFRIFLENIHKAKHGSDTGTYDNEGRFIPQKLEDFFAKYGDGEKLTRQQLIKGVAGQRVIFDPVGWGGVVFEWTATYLLLWPEDGIIRKSDVRGIYDGSLFYEVKERRMAANRGTRAGVNGKRNNA
ncbi:Caleosin related protein-domain-containing protein [Pyronema omphalodes]|nr:Caleosin related protein-domain-containing protein [Pyronema omphalodes]